jgi:aspartate aminotransferase, cytoplasmic
VKQKELSLKMKWIMVFTLSLSFYSLLMYCIEYLPLEGLPEFISSHARLVFGDASEAIASKRVASIQAVSGTGGLRVGAEFLMKFVPVKKIYIPNVTWVNHWHIFEAVGLETISYSYLDSTGLRLDFDGFQNDLLKCPEGSVVLLHMIAHNPSGIDPTPMQWNRILEIIKSVSSPCRPPCSHLSLSRQRKLIPFIDNAYQGFANDIETDAYAARLFADSQLETLVACSCSKNFGLYAQRAGCLHVLSADAETSTRVLSQLKAISRTLVSNCPAHGARIVSLILNDPTLKELWISECQVMCNRLNSVRTSLHGYLTQHEVPGNWDHILTQRGMFSFTGLSREAIALLQRKHHVYMLDNGRISLAGLNSSNLERFAIAIGEVLRSLGRPQTEAQQGI